jgi:hypothetical protein
MTHHAFGRDQRFRGTAVKNASFHGDGQRRFSVSNEPFSPLAIVTGPTGKRRSNMKRLSIIAATTLLIGSSAAVYAAEKPGASGMAPGTRMNSTTNPGTTRGASEFSPGDQMNDKRTVGSNPGTKRGASEFSPGDKMNDARGR